MLYKSTRGNEKADDASAVLMGIAPDGGLFVLPDFDEIKVDVEDLLKKDLLTRTASICNAFLPELSDLSAEIRSAYEGSFDDPDITPLKKVGSRYVLELYHGPTCAFKDMALLILPKLVAKAAVKKGMTDKILVLTATSGDTGASAINGFSDVPGTGIIVFYPSEGVSEIQKEQMIKSIGKNVAVCGIKGNFDDCQSAVKETFQNLNATGTAKTHGVCLASANSINIGRLVPQVAYYFTAYAKLMEQGVISFGDPVDYVVPTGNFGDILAGYYAKRIGLPVGKLVCASNENRILTDFLETGTYDLQRDFVCTSSPSMDILISSNFERLLYYASNKDTGFVSDCMQKMKKDKKYTVPAEVLAAIRKDFVGYCATEDECKATIRSFLEKENYLADPHTAVGLCCAERYEKDRTGSCPVVVLSTASPYKFSDAVLDSLGMHDGSDIFTKIQNLESKTGVPAPESLKKLKHLSIKQKMVIHKEKIFSYIKDYLKLYFNNYLSK